MNIESFKRELSESTVHDFYEKYIINDINNAVVPAAALEFLKIKLREKFQIDEKFPIDAYVVGSAKFGFAYLENQRLKKPDYREYNPNESDVDIAIVSPAIYGKIWSSLAAHGAVQSNFPWLNDMSNHMFHGWLRPDKFRLISLQACEDWRNAIYESQRSKFFRIHKLRCGLYQSKSFLGYYQKRGFNIAKGLIL